jgi:hypothetical protein
MTLEEALVVLPTIVDRVVNVTGPAAIAIGGEAQLFYFGLALLSAQLWRLTTCGPAMRYHLIGPT